MGKYRFKKRKISIIFYLACLVLLIRTGIFLGADSLGKELKKRMGNFCNHVVIEILEHSNVQISYALHRDINMVSQVAERMNESNYVYRFVKESYSAQNLIIYDPNDFAVENQDILLAEHGDSTPTQNPAEQQSEEGSSAVQTQEQNGQNAGTTFAAPAFSKTFTLEQLNDFEFLKSNLYVVPARAKLLSSDLNAEELLAMDFSIKKDASVPQILIYHTHGSETFVDSTKDLQKTGIMAVGAYLARVLSAQYGYNVIHCTELFDNVNGVFDRSKAYDYSREAVIQILQDHPTIQLMIDLHRDGVRDNLHLVTEVNGKQTAQIMFFNGVSRTAAGGDIDYLYNKYRSQNLSFSLQAKLEAVGKYPNFTRKNYIDAYQYNLDLLPRAMLIESGAQTNTLQEELNAMEPLADILDSVLSGKSREHMGLTIN